MAVDRYQVHVLYCPVAEQFYSAVEQMNEGDGRIVSFLLEKPPQGKVAIHPRTRLVRKVSPKLRSCMICHSDVSCSCECLRKQLPCEKKVGYRFQCLYCKKLQSVTVTAER